MGKKFTAPPTDKYVAAFQAIGNLHETYLEMLKVHYCAPNRTITAIQLSQAVGYINYGGANLHYGRLGRLIGEQLGAKFEMPLEVLVTFQHPGNEWEWIMHPQVAEALEVIGWVENIPLEEEKFCREFYDKIESSLKEKSESRTQRLKQASKFPSSVRVVRTEFKRNPDVVAEVLARANGYCEECGNPAPFVRASDGTPYLEIHHKTFLSDGGEDTVENTMALCPNCHRKKHFGV